MTAEEFFKEKYSDHNSMVYYPPSEYRIAEIMEEYARYYHQAKTRWIPVEERLPESNLENCIAAIEYKVIGEKWSKGDPAKAHINMNEDWSFFDDSLQEIYDDHRIRVTHWKPLPEPTKD
jgi:hypothetical protein